MSVRLDVALTERGLTESRTKALERIKSGAVKVNGVPITKPAFPVSEEDRITCDREGECPYVSRGGYKLEAALDAFGVDPAGLLCLDIGASSGGFTDCLRQRGASRIYAVDAGRDQLHPSLRADPKVVSLENRNARYLTENDIPETVDLIVMDVSFISQTKLYAALLPFLKPNGKMITLIKPQFEVGRSGIGKGGIVKDEKARQSAVTSVTEAAALYGLACQRVIPSPILGGDGNREFLALFLKEREENR